MSLCRNVVMSQVGSRLNKVKKGPKFAFVKDFFLQSCDKLPATYSLFCWNVTVEIVRARELKVFPQKKNASSRALPSGKRGTGRSSSSDVVCYSIGLRSLYGDQGFLRPHRSFLYNE